MRAVVVGDVHAKVEDLDECRSLVELVFDVFRKNKADFIIWLGDQTHNHSIVRVEVLNFWLEVFSQKADQIALVGNHDMAGDGSHSMAPYADRVTIVDAPYHRNGILFAPFCSNEELITWSKQHVNCCNTLFCHATFDGSVYENGFYAKEALSADLILQSQIISGHIHAPQSIGRVQYVGAPRWMGRSDANIDRNIWVVEFDLFGRILFRMPFATESVCKRIWHHIDKPDGPMLDERIRPGDRVLIDIVGPIDFCNRRKVELSAPGRVIKTLPTGNAIRVKESEGIDVAFKKFFQDFVPPNGTNKDKLAELSRKHLNVDPK